MARTDDLMWGTLPHVQDVQYIADNRSVELDASATRQSSAVEQLPRLPTHYKPMHFVIIPPHTAAMSSCIKLPLASCSNKHVSTHSLHVQHEYRTASLLVVMHIHSAHCSLQDSLLIIFIVGSTGLLANHIHSGLYRTPC